LNKTMDTSDQVGPRGELTTEEKNGRADLQWTMQVQLAEYQAVTTRITYWITLQFSVVPITGGALLLLTGTGKLFPPAFTIWAAAAIIEIGIGAYFYTLYEMMSNAQYLECELAGRVRRVLPDAPVWQYELYKKGNHVYSPAGIFIMMAPSISVPLVALWLHHRFWPPLSGVGDTLGTSICVGIAGIAFIIAWKASQAQKQLWECAVNAGNLLSTEAPRSFWSSLRRAWGRMRSALKLRRGGQPRPQPDDTTNAAPHG
jgi:hypothetical protein